MRKSILFYLLSLCVLLLLWMSISLSEVSLSLYPSNEIMNYSQMLIYLYIKFTSVDGLWTFILLRGALLFSFMKENGKYLRMSIFCLNSFWKYILAYKIVVLYHFSATDILKHTKLILNFRRWSRSSFQIVLMVKKFYWE